VTISRDDACGGEVAGSGMRLSEPSGYYQRVLGDETAQSWGNARARDELSRRVVDERDGGRMAVANRDLIVVGASAGGVEALREFVRGLPGDLPAAVLVVLHLPAGGSSALAAILGRSGPLRAVTARPYLPLELGTVAVAPPDHHLLVVDGEMVLSRGPTESGHRPAVDALFRSAARARGPRVIAVQLSGSLDDGAAGARRGRLSRRARGCAGPGGRALSGHAQGRVAAAQRGPCAAAAEMGTLMRRLTTEPMASKVHGVLSELDAREIDISLYGDRGSEHDLTDLGEMSGFACPDCDGVLVQLAGTDRFRCRVGHAWTEEALLSAHGDRLEQALWTAYRIVEEESEPRAPDGARGPGARQQGTGPAARRRREGGLACRGRVA